MTGPLAYLDGQRQLVVVDGQTRRPLTRLEGVLWGAWDQPHAEDVHSWPTWSPDGRRIAAFRVRRDGSCPRPVVVDHTGFWASEGVPLDDRVPIYLQWSPDGTGLAMLSQGGDALALDAVDARVPERVVRRLEGSPLFFTFLRDGRLAAFVGGEQGQSLCVLGADGGRVELPGRPTNFCVPVELGDELVYVASEPPAARRHGRLAVVAAKLDGTRMRELELVDGLVALLPSPDGHTVARAVALDGDETVYRDLRLIDVNTGLSRRVSDGDCVAFFFAGDGLVVARRHPHRHTIAWMWLSRDGRDERLIAELRPSRDLRFWLRFFEQYAVSHPLVSPDGSTLALCGGLVGRSAPEAPPQVWSVPIHDGDPTALDVGPFATFAPTSR